jgi:hypothetical protein
MHYEIFSISLDKATDYFLKYGKVKFNDNVIDALVSILNSRLKNPDKGFLLKVKPEKLLANLIMGSTIYFLFENDISMSTSSYRELNNYIW